MNFTLATISGLALALVTTLAATGCAAETAQNADEAASSSDDLIGASEVFSGAFQHSAPVDGPTSFTGLVFMSDGTFFGDADTGIRCITAPCPSAVHVEGTFAVSKTLVRLTAKAGAPASDFYGRYKYTLTDTGLTLTRGTGDSAFSQELAKQESYCAAASDCGAQPLVHPECAPGGWTCGAAKHVCSFACGLASGQ